MSGPVDIEVRKPDNEQEYDFLEGVSEDLMHAIHSKDIKAICEALRAAFSLLESEPHEEGPHV